MSADGTFRHRATARTAATAAGVVLASGVLVGWTVRVSHGGEIGPSTPPPGDLSTVVGQPTSPRASAHVRERAAQTGPRRTWNVALDEGVSGDPVASSAELDGDPALAVDGDSETAWRGAAGQERWTWELPFRRAVHLGLIRAHFGDAPDHGVPAEYRWEIRPPTRGQCAAPGPWTLVPNGEQRDRDPNTFLYGPKDVHAQRQALFADVDVCALRLVVMSTDGGEGPVLRELRVLEGAPSIARGDGTTVAASSVAAISGNAGPPGVVDGTYERGWVGEPASGPWVVTLRLPRSRVVDRIRLLLGADATWQTREDGRRRSYVAGMMPVDYRVLTSPSDDERDFVVLPEGAPPTLHESPLPVRRRLLRFAPRAVKALRLEITRATGPDGETEGPAVAPVVREIGVYEARDPRPVVTEPMFLSVDANPSELVGLLRGTERYDEARFARDAFHRLRRIVVGFDADTGWPADPSRVRDGGAGRFLHVIPGDDSLLRREMLEAIAPPPVVMLSGSYNWEYGEETASPRRPRGRWTWDPRATADDPDRGMGLLRDVISARRAPVLGFCGGAQILALLDAPESAPLDSIVVRNENRTIRASLDMEPHPERAWWTDAPASDGDRPRVWFLPSDPLFAMGGAGARRDQTRELPISHIDMIRTTAFDGPLRDLQLVAWSRLCARWVDPLGPEPTWPDPRDPASRCVDVPQAFRSRDRAGYPLIGFQFHPEQRDLTRLAPDSPRAARGDALNIFANSIDLVLDAYVSQFWSGALRHAPERGRWRAAAFARAPPRSARIASHRGHTTVNELTAREGTIRPAAVDGMSPG